MRVIAGIFLALTAILTCTTAYGDEEKTVKIVLYPSPEARPALKYQLLPPFMERRPGNAAVFWNRLPAERNIFFGEFEKEYDPSGKINTWQKFPLGDPREKEYREKELVKVIDLLKPGNVYFDMERAARFESCDWQLPVREGNYVTMILPEIQQTRLYARLLAAKAHLEIAEGKYDEAVRTFQTGYAEARHVAQGQTIINSLVGVVIAGIMSYELQQFIQQPDAPNLYWALSTLPRPLVDFRPGGEAESKILYLQFPELRDIDKKNMPPEAWHNLLDKIVRDIPNFECGPPEKNKKNVTTEMWIKQGYASAKRYLIEHGSDIAKVESMPPAQTVLLYWVKLYDELSDNQFKYYLLPCSEVGNRLEKVAQHQKEILATGNFPVDLIPTITPAKEAETRCQWNLAVLRIFEAMRLYAAVHDGRWPERLADITEVPIPTNPYDDKPFSYRREGDKVVLTSEMGPKNVPGTYEIKLMQHVKK